MDQPSCRKQVHAHRYVGTHLGASHHIVTRYIRPLYKALSCDAFIRDNYTRSEYRQHLLIFIQAIKRWTRNLWHRTLPTAAPRPRNKNLTPHTLTSYLSKIKLCSDYYFKQDAASAGQRVHDAGDKATIKYINNSYRRTKY